MAALGKPWTPAYNIQDHLNDVMSNVAAICGAAVSGHVPRLWWVDPACAILFSALIIRNWAAICWEQVRTVLVYKVLQLL